MKANEKGVHLIVLEPEVHAQVIAVLGDIGITYTTECAHDVRHANTGRCTRCGQNGGTS